MDIASCQQLITSASCMHDISNIYAFAMPDWLTDALLDPELERHQVNILMITTLELYTKCKIYICLTFLSRGSSQGMTLTHYIWQLVMNTGLTVCMKNIAVFQPEPCQFYSRKNQTCINQSTSLSAIILAWWIVFNWTLLSFYSWWFFIFISSSLLYF